MPAIETRLSILLVAAMCCITGGLAWAILRLSPEGSGSALHWVGLTLASGALAALCSWALQREALQRQRLALEQACALVLANPDDRTNLAHDALPDATYNSIRKGLAALNDRCKEMLLRQKDLELQLRVADAQRRQAETMLNGIPSAVLVTNAFDELMLANPSAAELFGFDLATSLRRPVAALVNCGRVVQDIHDMRCHYTRTHRRVVECDIPIGKRIRSYSITYACVLDNTGALAGVVTVLYDTTREKEISRLKNEFVSHVSHELRTPLSSIKAYVEMLLDGEASDEATCREFYSVIQNEADRLSRLIDNILNISRIEAGMTVVQRKELNLGHLVEEVLEVAMPAAREKRIAVRKELTPVFCEVTADRDLLCQALLNLVGNALKYTPAEGIVTVRTAVNCEKQEFVFEVSDTGVGIPQEAMGRLFEKFFRVEQNKKMAKGSGLGLHLTRQIIESVHHGRMHVASEAGRGSTFGFTLPLADVQG